MRHNHIADIDCFLFKEECCHKSNGGPNATFLFRFWSRVLRLSWDWTWSWKSMSQRNECVQWLWDCPSTVLICSVPKTPHRCVESAVQPKVVALDCIGLRAYWSLIPAQKLYNHLKPPAPKDRKGWRGLSSTMCAGKVTARGKWTHSCAENVFPSDKTVNLELCCLKGNKGGINGEIFLFKQVVFLLMYSLCLFYSCTHCS